MRGENNRVTFVMPAYNAADYIGEAIDSLIAQSVADWKLIVVNDGSTDTTPAIARHYSDNDDRISVIDSLNPSGCVYQPRKKGILAADTEWVSPLDADDAIEPTYLERLLEVRDRFQADIVYPTMWRMDSRNPHIITPKEPSLLNTAFTGRDAVKFTLDGWRINCNGGVIRKSVYEEAFEKFDSSLTYRYSDELLTRQIISLAPCIAFSDAKYFYRLNDNSITQKKSIKNFEILKNHKALISFTEELYGKESEEYLLAQKQNFHGIFDQLRLMNKYRLKGEEKKSVLSMMEENRSLADFQLLEGRVSPRYAFLLKLGLFPASLGVKLYDILKRD